MSRLPVPGSDDGQWGTILNDYLNVAHNADGTLKPITDSSVSAISESKITGLVADLAAKTDKSTLTTLGDIYVASAASTPSRLGVGSNGQKLVSDSTQALGVKWATDAYILAVDYGVKFDGATDDSSALQSAITAAVAANKPLILAPGTAIVGTTLSISSPITIIGSGRQATILKAKAALNDYVFTFSGGSAGVGIVGAHFSDFTIDGNSSNLTAGGGILANGAVQCSFVRIHCTNCYNWGLQLGPITGGAFGHHNRIVECLFDSTVVSGGFGGGVTCTSSDENWFYGSDFEGLGGSTSPVGSNPIMLYDQAGLQHIVESNFVSGTNNCIGVRVQNAKDTKIVSCTFDGTAGDSVFISGTRCIIANNIFTSPGDNGSSPASGVHLEFNTHYNVVSSNVLETAANTGKTRSLIREESTGGGGDNVITGNTLSANAAATVALLESAGANTILRNNIGWVTESHGTATVANGSTSIAVNHTLSVTPALTNISVTPTNNLGSAAKFWISGVSSTQFTINTNADPGVTTATFAWSVRM